MLSQKEKKCFKPYYKWIIFNIINDYDTLLDASIYAVLNLIING